MGFTYVQLGDNDPVRISDDESVVAVFEARGFKQVDDPTAPGAADTSVEAAEVDDRGQGWVYLDHPDLPGGPERFPVEVVAAQRELGWELPSVLEAAKAKKPAKKSASKSTAGDTPEEK